MKVLVQSLKRLYGRNQLITSDMTQDNRLDKLVKLRIITVDDVEYIKDIEN